MSHRQQNSLLAIFNNQLKHCICSQKDLNTLYATKDKQLVLWCDGRLSEEHFHSESTSKKRKKSEERTTKQEEKEQRVEDLTVELQELHSGSSMTSNIGYWPE